MQRWLDPPLDGRCEKVKETNLDLQCYSPSSRSVGVLGFFVAFFNRDIHPFKISGWVDSMSIRVVLGPRAQRHPYYPSSQYPPVKH